MDNLITALNASIGAHRPAWNALVIETIMELKKMKHRINELEDQSENFSHFKVATQEFLEMTFQQQCAVLDAQKYSKVKLSQAQIDAQFERHAAIASAKVHFQIMAEKWKLGVVE